MKVVAFVPLKLNNERLPNKNTKPFSNGVPLLQYILDTLVKISTIDEVYVYCSDDQVVSLLPEKTIFKRRSEILDLSTTKINEVMQAFLSDVDADIYVLAHATAPFLKQESIEKALRKVISKAYDSALSVVRLQEFLWSENKPFNYDPLAIPRTQDLPPMFAETTGLYIYTKDVFVNRNTRIGENPFLLEVSKIEAIDINEPVDFEIANAISNFLTN
jgi:CMP-N-acetylneuraminic acid synthetase